MTLHSALATSRTALRQTARFRDEMHKARALVVDGNPTTRSVLCSQLRELGVGHVSQCGRIAEARNRLEATRYDIVLCEQRFPDSEGSGQQLLDDLRRNQLLPLSTVFIMITSEATYAKVAEAAESALDSYLLKPHNTANLADRLAHARRRKAVLKDILEAVDAGRYETAAQHCLERFHRRQEYWLYAARIGAELLLNLGRHEEARALFDAVLGARALPWAKLGVARAQIEGGEMAKAVRTLESLILEDPTFVDAYDVMGRARLEQGDFAGAMEVYVKAAALTPESVTRLQKAGMLAYYRGDLAEAAKCFDRAVRVGMGSKMFDWQTAVLLAFARFHEGDTRGLQRCCDDLGAVLAKAPQSQRLSRLSRTASVLLLLLHQRETEALAMLDGLAAELDAVDFDLEAASNMIGLLSMSAGAGIRVEGAEQWIDRIAQRHTGSKIHTELLVRAAALHPPFAERIQAGHTHIGRLAEAAMAFALKGQPEQAVRQLIVDVEATLNAKLMDTACAALQRYRQRIESAPALTIALEDLRKRIAPQRSPLVDASGRKAGALVLRRAGAGPGVDGAAAAPSAPPAGTSGSGAPKPADLPTPSLDPA
ncbi:MAG: hypothetical protein AMXMBFR66_23330 [Pseudomonadota bacterium]